jgi:hypothetical protein
MQRKALKERGATGSIMLLVALSVGAQSAPWFPAQTKPLPLKAYINNAVGFELSYPVTYRRKESSLTSAPSHSEQSRVLLYATTGPGERRCEDQGECDEFGTLVIALDSRHFDLETIGKHYEHTGWTQAAPFRVGAHTFYYIGAGGGGVAYPDTFFYNLHGRILVIEFSGPYPLDSKSPSHATKSIERVVLESFHPRSEPQQQLAQ